LPSIRDTLAEAVSTGAKLYSVMTVLSALFILAALALGEANSSLAPNSSQLGPLPSAGYSTYQILVHVVTGFAAGALSLDPAIALVGAGTGPLVDLDHIGFFVGLPVEARVAHSIFFVAALLLVEWRTRFWAKGTRNFALFILLQYSVHFAVAPPGFPLLAPFSTTIYDFPRIIPAVLAVIVALAFVADSLMHRGERQRSRAAAFGE
jgi:hypothetical protein